MPVVTRQQSRRPLRSALLVASDYRGFHVAPTVSHVNDAYLIKRFLTESQYFEEKNISVWTDTLPTGLFADPTIRTTSFNEKKILGHLLTLVREDFSRVGDTIFFFCSGHQAHNSQLNQEPRVIIGRAEDDKTNVLRASALRFVVQSVPAGVHFTMGINSCGSSAMAEGWARFQFPFVRPPNFQPEHYASEFIVALTSTCSATERSYSLRWYEPFQCGISYFPFALVRVLERQNGAMTHSRLIENISDFLMEFKANFIIQQGLSNRFLHMTRHHPSLLCRDTQLSTSFLQL
ncbi:hypothetical protein TSUD_412940 [Trifolium subterraneum]|uniref:Caspase family p20 domain-containing protein n=1 Tax=Trifolium subterraneum TaxID=3900 RepID=A0A2Z6P6H5_TRISU|nr:hypothetical protein TSUD_412940 [Trifolium subterraneum]